MSLNYLYLLIVVLIVMVKAFTINYAAYYWCYYTKTSCTCHSGLQYNCKNLYDKGIHIQMMLDTDFYWFRCSHCHSLDTILGFLQILWCKKNWVISCTAILQFCFLYRISSILLFSSSFPIHNPLSSSNFCHTRISTSPVTLSSLDCGSWLVQFN